MNQPLHLREEGGRGVGPGKAGPLHAEKFLGDEGVGFARVIDDDRDEEGDAGGHVVGALDGELPFAAEIALEPGLRPGRDDGQEQRALANLPPDLRVPGVAAAEFILVEPHLVPGGAQRLADAPGRRSILARVAQEDRGGSHRIGAQ